MGEDPDSRYQDSAWLVAMPRGLMDQSSPSSRRGPSFAELFTPKLITVFREGYGLADLRADAIAGLTVAIVALPLSMAIAIASGVAPERGLYTAIIGGALISLLGGSRFQIGGPAGAFIVLIAAIVEREGYSGLVLATLIGGALLVAIGFLQLGTFIKYIPYPVTIGFTSGIAVIIFTSQLRELLGLDMASRTRRDDPQARGDVGGDRERSIRRPSASQRSSLVLILGIQRIWPRWPSLLIAVVVAAPGDALPRSRHRDAADPFRRRAERLSGTGLSRNHGGETAGGGVERRRHRLPRRH